MRFLFLLWLLPFATTAQINPVYVAKSNLAYSKLEASGDGMFGFVKDDKFGYADRNGKEIISATYPVDNNSKTIPAFTRGHVIIREDGKYGMLGRTGKILLPFSFDYLYQIPTLGNYAIAGRKENNRTLYGVITTQNEPAVPLDYEEVVADSSFFVIKQNGKWGMADKTGRIMITPEFSNLLPYARANILKAEKDGQYGFVDRTGKWLFTKAKNVYTLYTPAEGLIPCMVSGKYGYLDYKGEEVVITRYDYGNSFDATGLARVGKKSPASSYSFLYGYIDKKGNEVIPLKYETLGSFSNGLAFAKDAETNRYGYLDKTGKWAIKASFLDAQSFDDWGGAWVKMTDGKYHYIGKTGNDFGAFDDANYRNFKADGYAVFEHDDYPYFLIDKTGKPMRQLEDCDAIYSFSEGIAGYKIKSTARYGFIDVSGANIGTAAYDGFSAFAEGFSRVEKKTDGKTKFNFLNSKGENIYPSDYDDLRYMRNGWGIIKKDGSFFFVDKNGNMKEPPRKYDNIVEFRSGYAVGVINGLNKDPNTYYYINTGLKEEFRVDASQAYQFWEDVAVINQDSVYALMNKKGEIFKRLDHVVFLKFCTDDRIAVKANGKWGFIDSKGNDIIKAKYDSCDQFKYGYAKVKQANKWGIIDKSGKEIIAPQFENIMPGENGIFAFYDKTWGVIDKTGQVLVSPTFYTITPFEKDRALARMGLRFSILKSPLAR